MSDDFLGAVAYAMNLKHTSSIKYKAVDAEKLKSKIKELQKSFRKAEDKVFAPLLLVFFLRHITVCFVVNLH